MNSNHVKLGFVLAVCLSLCGCGSGEPELRRLAVTGQVTAGADKAVNGAISFLPDEGNSGPSVTTSISAGEYRFDTTNGPIAGKYKVVIVPGAGGKGGRKLPAAGAAPDTSTGTSTPNSGGQTLTATVSAEDTSFDFNLK